MDKRNLQLPPGMMMPTAGDAMLAELQRIRLEISALTLIAMARALNSTGQVEKAKEILNSISISSAKSKPKEDKKDG